VSPLVAYHSTPRRHRASIERHGLLCGLPNVGQHFGVYVYSDDYEHATCERRRSKQYWVYWAHRPPNDLWRVAYIGPLCPDQYVANALVLFERVQVLHLSRVTS
jgi:hypothetical protein